ncbi:MAG: spore germination protein [Alicyclobacillus sp.]|nr:spore germination protein [Alicyclobacillus sp.]
MLKQRNRNVVAILTFEATIGPATFEWIPAWLNRVRTQVWVPFAVYVFVAVGLTLVIVSLVARMDTRRPHAITLLDAWIRTRWVSAAFNGIMLIAFIVNAGIVLRTAIHLIKYIALPYTPFLILAVLAMLVPLQLFTGGMDAVLRYGVVLFWPTVVVGVAMLLLCFEVSDPANLLPLWPHDWGSVAAATPQVLYLLPGLMLFTVYLPSFRFAQVDPGAMRGMALVGFLSAATLQALNLGLVLMDFGPSEGASLNWPVVEAVRMQHAARWAVLFLLPIPILIAVSSAINLYTFAAYRILVYYTRRRSLWLLIALFGVVVALCVVPESFEHVYQYYVPVLEAAEAVIYACLVALWIRVEAKGRAMSP